MDSSASLPAMPPLAQRHFGTVFDIALQRWPDKVAVRDPDTALTYRQLTDRALRLAGGFSRLDVGRQANVLMMLDNHVDFVICWTALSLTARVEVPINTAYLGALLAHIINTSAAKVLVIEAHYVERINAIAAELPGLTTVVVRGGDPALVDPRWRRLGWETLSDGPPDLPATLHPSDVMAILYTSGTTGPSKGSINSHGHGYTYAHPTMYGAARHDDVTMVTLPLFHMGGQWAAVYNAFIAGATVVVLPRFSASTFWEQAQLYGATYCFFLGAMTHFLLNQPVRDTDHQHPLKNFLLVPVPPEVDEFKARFGIEKISTAFGSTEAGVIAHAPLGTAVAGRAGWLRPGVEAIIVDEHGIEVPAGQVGEIWVRAREPWTMTSGYFGMPEATAAASQNFWFHTGDAVRLADDGQFVFIDRIKDAIRRRGENVSSFEVEREIGSHPAVAESAVVAVPSEYVEDEIKACVVLHPGQSLAPQALLTHLAGRLPAFAVPRYVEFMAELPKTPTAKVRKNTLRAAGITPATWDREAAGFKLPDHRPNHLASTTRQTS